MRSEKIGSNDRSYHFFDVTADDQFFSIIIPTYEKWEDW